MPGKKYTDAAKKYDKTQLHEPAQAFELVKSLSKRNFDGDRRYLKKFRA